MIDPGIRRKGALVTGVNNPEGVGAAVVRALAGQGARLFLTYLRSEAQGLLRLPPGVLDHRTDPLRGGRKGDAVVKGGPVDDGFRRGRDWRMVPEGILSSSPREIGEREWASVFF